jgi:hypothetical protein
MKVFLQKQKNHKDVVEISLSDEQSKQLYWEDKDEFSYKGEMYDVIEKKTVKNQLVIRCIDDKKETSLLNEYQKNNKKNSSNSTTIQLITTQFVLPDSYSLKQPEKIIKKIFSDHSPSLTNLISAVLPQPPDVC